MHDYEKVLLLALLPAAGNIAGGLLSEAVHVSERALSFALHTAAGIVTAVLGVELMPKALGAGPPWLIVVGFVAGGCVFILVDRVADRFQPDAQNPRRSAAWPIFFGVAVDLFSDGVMIGAGGTVSLSLAALLAAAQMPADFPEGFATIALFKGAGVKRRTRLLLSAAFAVPILTGATVGYWFLRDQSDVYKMIVLAFTAGLLLAVVAEEILTEAHRGEHSEWDVIALVGGFGLFSLISSYFGD